MALACTAVRDDFASFYWTREPCTSLLCPCPNESVIDASGLRTAVRTYEEELKQQKAGGFPDVISPEIWDINST